ncbi:MAG: hypothetical protein ACYTEQ_12255 [Planctomycetota bacterium]|jgi:hypothetical protein
MLIATISGSFHRHMTDIKEASEEFRSLGVRILSPEDTRIVDQKGDFLFVASDGCRSIQLVQNRHLEAIIASDFLWLVAPNGYVGQSASMEMGFSVANNIPVIGVSPPSDLTLKQYVRLFPTASAAVEFFSGQRRRNSVPRLLINTWDSVHKAQDLLRRIEKAGFLRSQDLGGY